MAGLIILEAAITYGIWRFWEAFYIITWRCSSFLPLLSRGVHKSVLQVSDDGVYEQ